MMIRWSLQSEAETNLARVGGAIVRGGILSPGERQRLAALVVPKRRREWLLGRFTAKNLVRRHLADTTGGAVPLEKLVIDNDGDGAPEVRVPRELRADRLSLSISHSNGTTLCALSAVPGTVVGADIEIVAPRSRAFVEDYFTTDEVDQVLAAPSAQHDELVNAIWSAKEAVLKALHLGLSVDTRRVDCDMRDGNETDGWRRFTASAKSLVAGLGDDDGAQISGWWRRSGSFVLTLAVLAPGQRRILRPDKAPPRPRRRALARVA